MGVYFRGGYFPWGFISYLKLGGVFSVGGYFLDPARILKVNSNLIELSVYVKMILNTNVQFHRIFTRTK